MSQPPSPAAFREQQLRRTTLASLLSRVVAFGARLVTVPILVGALGTSGYGIWATIAALAGWMGTVNLGVVPALVQMLAAKRPVQDEEAAIASAFWIQTLTAAVVFVLTVAMVAAAPWSTLLSTAEPADHALARHLLVLVGVTIAASLPLSVASAVLTARQRGDEIQVVQTATTVSTLAAVLLAHTLSGPTLLIPTILIGSQTIGQVWLWRRLRGRICSVPSLRSITSRSFKEVLNTGKHFVAIGIAGLVIVGTDALVISIALGPESVAAYSATMTITQTLPLFLGLPLNAAWPAYVEAAANADVPWILRTHRRMERLTLLAAGLWVILTAVCAPAIAWWSGISPGPDRLLVALCGVAASLQAFTLPTDRLITALGKAKVIALLGALNAAVNFVLSILLVGPFGTYGVALGTVIAYAVVIPIIRAYARRSLRGMLPDQST